MIKISAGWVRGEVQREEKNSKGDGRLIVMFWVSWNGKCGIIVWD